MARSVDSKGSFFSIDSIPQCKGEEIKAASKKRFEGVSSATILRDEENIIGADYKSGGSSIKISPLSRNTFKDKYGSPGTEIRAAIKTDKQIVLSKIQEKLNAIRNRIKGRDVSLGDTLEILHNDEAAVPSTWEGLFNAKTQKDFDYQIDEEDVVLTDYNDSVDPQQSTEYNRL